MAEVQKVIIQKIYVYFQNFNKLTKEKHVSCFMFEHSEMKPESKMLSDQQQITI